MLYREECVNATVLHVQHVRKTFGAATVIADVTFVLIDGEHVGLIGPNGTGKSRFEGTIIVVAHDRAFLRKFGRRTLEIRAGHVTSLSGGGHVT